MRIGIIGIGGVGGYFGGLLAEHYSNSTGTQIIFIARSETELQIKKYGLQLKTSSRKVTIHPDEVSNDPAKIGQLDLVICCVKSYDLESSLLSIKDCVSRKTIILPLLNGIDLKDRILKLYPENDILEGCVYLVSRLIKPGIVEQTGTIHRLYFGSKTLNSKRLERIEKLLSNANIECYLTPNILEVIWAKYIFVSSIATLTSYLNLPIGEILKDELHSALLKKLLTEVIDVASKKEIDLSNEIFELTLEKIKSLPPETTSSMHYDFYNGNRTEVHALTQYVVQLADALGLSAQTYRLISSELIDRQN